MKILKIKSILFNLMAIAMLTVFLTSCGKGTNPLSLDEQQKTETQSTVKNLIKEEGEITFNLPIALENADQESIKRYLADMTNEQVAARVASYRIENYLESLDRLDKVYNDLGEVDLLNQSDLIKYTSEQELAYFNFLNGTSEIESQAKCFILGTWCFEGVRFKWHTCCTWYGKCKNKVKYEDCQLMQTQLSS